MLLYAPNSDLRGFNDSTTVQQADVLPTLLSLLGYPKSIVAFGNNMLSAQSPHFAVCDFDGTYQLIEEGFVLQHDGEHPTALFNYVKDNELSHNLLDSLPNRASRMTHRLGALLQTYNARMRTNNLLVEGEK